MQGRGRSWASRLALAGLIVSVASACGNLEIGLSAPPPSFDAGVATHGHDAGPPPPLDAAPDAPPEPPADAGTFDAGPAEFSVIYATILEPRCSCHTRQPVLGSLDMTSENKAYNNLVGFPPGSAVAQGASCASTLRPRVVPGDPGASLLWQKVQDFESRIRCGSRMPLGQAPLSYPEVVLITEWIRQGAL